jgi:hypothetical protein
MAHAHRRIALLLLCVLTFLDASGFAQQLQSADAVRVAEFYRLASQIQDKIWPEWSKTPAPLMLVTAETEFLFHHPSTPPGFKDAGGGVLARPRQFPTAFLATFPAFGPPAVIVIGQPQNTEAKTSTPWVIIAMHEHFHQLQYGKPGYDDEVRALNLSRGDNTGMWMLNYPFPYDKPEVAQGFSHLRDLLLQALTETDAKKARQLAKQYPAERKKVFALLSADDHKYIAFQFWQEGIARYTQIEAAEAAATYQPTAEFQQLPDYESFPAYAAHARQDTLDELKRADIAKWKRVFVYSFGAAEGMLLDRLHPGWQSEYFRHPLTTDPLFDLK